MKTLSKDFKAVIIKGDSDQVQQARVFISIAAVILIGLIIHFAL